MDIQPGRIMNNFLEPNRMQYAIPVYQRNYEWAKEQCVKLFEDIVKAFKLNKTHFCGSVVYALLKEEHDINCYVVIDGQQRLTTVYLLLKALLDEAKTDKEIDYIKESLYNTNKFDEYQIDNASKLKLKPVRTDNAQLLLLMDNKIDDMDKASGIWRNYSLFRELIKNQLAVDVNMTVKDIYKGVEKLLCARIKLDETDNAQEIFERINSTGVPLSLADKIRNYVLMTDANQEKLYSDYWIKIEQLIRKDEMSSFFSDFLNLKVDGFVKESEAYEEFKKLFVEKCYTNETILQSILHYAELYHSFLYGNSKFSESINNSLLGLRKLKQTTMFVFLFQLFDDYEQGAIQQKEFERVLKFLLNYSIRHIMCELGSNSLRGLYKTLYSRVFSKLENKSHYYDSIVSFFKQLTTKDTIPSKADFIKALKYNNLYRKNALCKLMLAGVENNGKEQVNTDQLTIEHIMPQNHDLSTEWKLMLGEEWEDVHDNLLHTLGNLTLTGYNSELGDKPFDYKKTKLQEKGSKMVVLNETVMSCVKWDKQSIELRATELASKICAIYSIEEPNVVVSFADPRYREYTCDNPSDATHKTPNYYVLLGERVIINSYADMLRSVVRKLYALDASHIEELARINSSVVSGWSTSVLTYEKGRCGCEEEIGNSGIYHCSGFSASHAIMVIQALLDIYEIDRSDFVYNAKVYGTKK